jgi:hypothetical protein
MSPALLHRIDVANATHRMGFTALAAAMAACCAAEFSSFTMSTTTTQAPATAGLFARKVAQVTGLSEMALDRMHTEDMGGPKHFFQQPGAAGGFVYTVAGLSRLVEILYAEGHADAALALRAELNKLCPCRSPLPVAPAGVNVRGEWQAKGVAA